jgi:hypothetical protein
MPVLVIAVVFLLLFLVMGAMSLSAVISERRYSRRAEKSVADTSLNLEKPRAAAAGK